MRFRHVVLFNGRAFKVPQGIQRIDHLATHGWQLRYGGTKMFSDHGADGSGAASALERATRELLRRIATLQAPTTLQRGPSRNKTSGLPPGISGPIVRQRHGSKVREASLAVLIPRFGDEPQRRSIYIGTENTYTLQKYEAALARAIEMRREAEDAYRRDVTRAKRAEGRKLRAERKAG
jgi:hypothetical protein